MIKAVIFDMDGVLIDSEPLHFDAVETVLKKYGIEIPEGYLDKYLGDTNERIWTEMTKAFGLKESIDFYIEQQLQSTIECIWRDDYKPIDGVAELLQELRDAGYLIGVASSSPPNIIQNILDRIGIAAYIDKWVSGDEVQESKPAPYIYTRAAEMLGFRPEECLAIEDSFYGVTAAKAAGLKCIGYKSPHAVEQDLGKADLIVENIRDISLKTIRHFSGEGAV